MSMVLIMIENNGIFIYPLKGLLPKKEGRHSLNGGGIKRDVFLFF